MERDARSWVADPNDVVVRNPVEELGPGVVALQGNREWLFGVGKQRLIARGGWASGACEILVVIDSHALRRIRRSAVSQIVRGTHWQVEASILLSERRRVGPA